MEQQLKVEVTGNLLIKGPLPKSGDLEAVDLRLALLEGQPNHEVREVEEDETADEETVEANNNHSPPPIDQVSKNELQKFEQLREHLLNRLRWRPSLSPN